MEKIPYGYCNCGCGEKTTIATRNRTNPRIVIGEPRGYIKGHALRNLDRFGKNAPRWKGGKTIDNHGYVRIYMPDHPSSNSRGYIFEHVLIVETVLGKQLPHGAKIHHVNERRNDNRNSNMVACEGNAYHKLLHQKLNALKACGNANWRKCWICKEHDDPVNLYILPSGTTPVHNSCRINRRIKNYVRI